MKNSYLAIALGLAVGIAVVLMWKTAHAQVTINSPIATVSPMTATSSQIIASNPSRKAIQICNPTAVVMTIIPGTAAAVAGGSTTGNGVTLPAVAAGVTSCYTSPFYNSAPAAGSAWQGILASSTGNALVMEWF
jgi:hypothetical protein